MTNRFPLLVFGLFMMLASCTASADTDLGERTVDEPLATALPAQTAEPTAAVPVAPTSTPVPVPTPVPTEVAAPTEVPAPTATALPTATPIPEPTPIPRPTLAAVAETDHSGLAGSRGLTLQWISWEPEDWGSVEFVPLVDGSYSVTGRQDGPNGDFVEVDGTMVRVTDRELRFDGTVTVRMDFTNEGQPCVRSGELTFLATGDRRFWRMQDLLNCDGVVTDYVDIYFG